MTSVAQLYRIQEAAALLGVSAHTLRWYDKVGLTANVERSPASHRLYSERDLSWLRFLLRLRATGMPVEMVGRYADLARAGEQTAPARFALLLEHERAVAGRVERLQDDLAVIRGKVEAYRAQLGDRLGAPTGSG